MRSLLLTSVLILITFYVMAQGISGYYSQPALHGETIVFVAEGDLWKASINGGQAVRLTSHPGDEGTPVISPDGKRVAFSAEYEGPTEVYVMPLTGGLPDRLTFEAQRSLPTAWASSSEIIYTTTSYSTLPRWQSVSININTYEREVFPLQIATEASFDSESNTLWFVNPSFNGNVAKRYEGGTARKIWYFKKNATAAQKVSDDFKGDDHHPIWQNNRIYFLSARDGIMNVWSMNKDGSNKIQHSKQTEYDVREYSVFGNDIVYRSGADLWLLNLKTNAEKIIPITILSDMDQLREKWVDDPENYITDFNIHPSGEKIVVTARGRVFTFPVKEGRRVEMFRKPGVRYRDAVFMPSGTDVLSLSDESGEFEFVISSASGTGTQKALTKDGNILRFNGLPSPDGKFIAYRDLNNGLWILEVSSGKNIKISTNEEGIADYSWSPDSKWIAFSQAAINTFYQLHIYGLTKKNIITLTTDRANSFDPVWSPDGNWIYFLSDRNFQTLVGAPWGSRQPEPYFDKQEKLYHISLRKGLQSPFSPETEIESTVVPKNTATSITIDEVGIMERIHEVPVAPGNFYNLTMNNEALYFMSRDAGIGEKASLMALKVNNKGNSPKEILQGLQSYKISNDGKNLVIQKDRAFYVVKAGGSPLKDLGKSKVDMSGWKFTIDPKEDWKQIYTDAWRMERDYFYDPNMHNVGWKRVYNKYLPLLDRITTRSELSDLIGEFVGELSVLHTSVRGGDLREGNDHVNIGSLGAKMSRSKSKGGYIIDYIYKSDPDYPDERSPLSNSIHNISEGDVIQKVNGEETLAVADINALLRNQGGKMVRLEVKSSKTGKIKEVVVKALSSDFNLRYNDWEYTRRLEVEENGEGKLGYVHLRAMGPNDVEQWYRDFYPVFNKQGLVLDFRNNRGGNIDSFILEKLLRQAWFYWKSRSGVPTWNMQYAFRGHMVILVDEFTASDGEAVAEGFRRLGLGKIIGVRTWGGEVWLSGVNRLSDNGLARAPMTGVYGPEGEWLIEWVGVIPDIEVVNEPHASFEGKDAQLEAAMQHLLELIEQDPREVPPPPAFPDKHFEKK